MAALGPFEPAPRLALAVSGGADSLALAALAARWAASRGGSGIALTVDHGLRPAAAAEAEWVAAAARRLGLDHRTLRWRPPCGGVTQAEARAARYRLLDEAAAAEGCLHLLVGHHRDDNARTVAMRRRRGDGPGLAGMPAVRELDRVRLLRPLLGFPAVRLRATAATLGHGWIDDPSNRDSRFERVRTASGEDVPATAPRAALEAAAAAWLAGALRREAHGGFWCDLGAWRALEASLAGEVLARLVTTTGEAMRPPGRGRVLDAARRLRAGEARLTLAGAIVGRAGDRLVVRPERATCLEARVSAERPYPLAPAPFGGSHVVTDAAILIC
jgi:tRNA(Ile)-lysidine synthase